MDNRGIDSEPGWINRKMRELDRAIEGLRSEKRASSTTIPSGGVFTVELGGNMVLHLPTTSATSNVVVDAVTGVLSRSTSSARFKQDIADLDVDLAAILKMRPRVWRDKRDVVDKADMAPRYVGFVAEELHDSGLGAFVGYDPDGLPESVNYDRLTVALLIALRWTVKQSEEDRGRIEALEAAVATQRAQIEALTTQLDALAPPPSTPPLTP